MSHAPPPPNTTKLFDTHFCLSFLPILYFCPPPPPRPPLHCPAQHRWLQAMMDNLLRAQPPTPPPEVPTQAEGGGG